MYQEVSFGTLGVNEANGLEFSLRPNPAKDKIEIRHLESGPLDVQIIDMRGRLVYKGSIGVHSASVEINLLAPGVYQVILSDGKKFS